LTEQDRARASRQQKSAWTLALSGFLPFGAIALWLIAGPEQGSSAQLAHRLLSGYAAVILSFLGGIRWGVALNRNDETMARSLALSVLPSLAGFFCLLLPVPIIHAAFAVCFAAQGAWDNLAAHSGAMPLWFARIRVTLTILVTLCLIAVFLFGVRP
jgi:hypothetical protein